MHRSCAKGIPGRILCTKMILSESTVSYAEDLFQRLSECQGRGKFREKARS